MSEWYAVQSHPDSYLTIPVQVTQKSRLLTEEPDKVMLAKLRSLENKMGLVLTLVSIHDVHSDLISSFEQFKASVWGVINEQPQSIAYSDPNDTTIMR